ncbi:MAG: hypothetical protein ABEI13_01630, partial [Candidatus Paceibacteria bacterium]
LSSDFDTRTGAILVMLSPAFYQVSVIFPIVYFYLLYRSENIRVILYEGFLAISVILLVLSPFIFFYPFEAFKSLISQTIIIPIYLPDGASFLNKIGMAIWGVQYGIVAILLGILYIIYYSYYSQNTGLWLALLVSWYLLRVLVLEMESAGDMLGLVTVSAIGFGLAISELSLSKNVVVMAILFLFISLGWLSFLPGLGVQGGPIGPARDVANEFKNDDTSKVNYNRGG